MTSLEEQGNNGPHTSPPEDGPKRSKGPVVLKPDVGDEVQHTADDVQRGEPVQDVPVKLGDVARHDRRGVEAEGLE